MKSHLLKRTMVLIMAIILTFSLFGAALAASGELDATFGTDGMVTSDFRIGGKVITDFGNDDEAYAVAIQTDGKIVVAGYTDNGDDEDFALARYNSDGSSDTDFGTDGQATTDFGGYDEAYGVAIQADGKIIVAGYTYNGSDEDFALAHYNSDGSLNTDFGTDGLVTTDFGGYDDQGRAVAIQTDGKIIVAGYTYNGDDNDFALARYNSDGALDTDFDTDGLATTDFGDFDYGYAIAIQTDGKIVVAGSSDNGSNNDFALARYNSDGSLDTDFDADGKVTTDFGGYTDIAYAIAIQPDGKIVVAGYNDNGSDEYDFALARYNSDGSLDTAFDTNGLVTTDFSGSDDQGHAVVIQTDGKIVVAGYSYDSSRDFAMARYNNDGSPDSSFDTDGRVTTDFDDSFNSGYAAALQPDGKIIVAGYIYSGDDDDFALVRYNTDGSVDIDFGKESADGSAYAYAVAVQPGDSKIVVAGWISDSNDEDMLVARYNTDGTLDTSFSGDGLATIDFAGDNDAAWAVVIQPDNKILVAGTGFLNWSPNFTDFALVRFNSDGSMDTSFDSDGIVTTNFGAWEYGTTLALQTDGKIVLGGYGSGSGSYDFLLARYNSDGSLDTAFDGDGMLTTALNSSDDRVQSVAIQADGKIVAAGFYTNASIYHDFALTRYNSDGSLDTDFDADGIVTTDFGGDYDEAYSVDIQTNGKIVAAGYTYTSANTDFALARYNSDGSLDTDFDDDGMVTTDFNSNSREYINAIALQTDGKIVAAGATTPNYGNPWSFALARYNSNGAMDTSFSTDGKTTTDFGSGGSGGDEAQAVAIQPDGKIVVAGSSDTPSTSLLALARYDAVSVPCSMTFTVTSANNSGAGSLRQAIADTCSGGTITFNSSLSGGTIRLASTLTFEKDVTIDGSGLASQVTVSGDTTGDGTGDVRVFYVYSAITVTLNSLTITKGAASDDGGGIYNDGGSLTITKSTLLGNQASNSGGGIYNNGGSLTVTNSTLSGNSAFLGGGINNYNNGAMTVINSTLSENSSSYYGGAILNQYGRLIVTNSTLSENSAYSGGGIYNTDTLTVTNSTLSGSEGTYGSGLSNWGILYFANTIIANSTDGGGPGLDCYSDDGASIVKDINNLVENNYAAPNNCGAPAVTDDPQLAGLTNNGGPTWTMALGASSPAIDAGDNATCAAAAVNSLDQRGQSRNDYQCDIGAFELKFTDSATVTKTVSGAGTYTFGPTMVKVVVNDAGPGGCLTGITIQRHNVSHPNATSPLDTGHWWEITPTGCTSGFNVNLTLPTDFTPDDKDMVCRWNPGGPGDQWDCALSSFTASSITRNGVTGFSEWTVGNNSGPTAITLRSLAAHNASRPLSVSVISGLAALVCFTAIIWRKRRTR